MRAVCCVIYSQSCVLCVGCWGGREGERECHLVGLPLTWGCHRLAGLSSRCGAAVTLQVCHWCGMAIVSQGCFTMGLYSCHGAAIGVGRLAHRGAANDTELPSARSSHRVVELPSTWVCHQRGSVVIPWACCHLPGQPSHRPAVLQPHMAPLQAHGCALQCV